jgi:hypothetical protein
VPDEGVGDAAHQHSPDAAKAPASHDDQAGPDLLAQMNQLPVGVSPDPVKVDFRTVERYRPPTCTAGRFPASGSASRRTSCVMGAVSPSPKSRKRNRYTIGFPCVHPK